MSAPKAVFELRAAVRSRRGAAAIGPWSLSVSGGELCVLLGPSGSGKSTLLALLAGVEPADGGSVFWAEQDVTHASESGLALLRRGRIGSVGQSFALLEHLPVWRGVAIAGVVQGTPLRAQRRRAMELLESLGLPAALADRRPRELSGGERQRAAVARALWSAEVGLIADEPTSNQDDASAQAVIDALSAARARGCALVIATHDPRLAALAQQRVLLAPPKGGP